MVKHAHFSLVMMVMMMTEEPSQLKTNESGDGVGWITIPGRVVAAESFGADNHHHHRHLLPFSLGIFGSTRIRTYETQRNLGIFGSNPPEFFVLAFGNILKNV